ncbi:hypothetical protein DMH26_12625 [Streptomyces sp. WAC 05379]|uniref:MFS transporter n=1 Tax=Streptomyces sp. WAC 05379 TaxID=2203207 RepID=UPI000F743219|nr:MFS transporter [Streptomyces sp. WAC 05379]RSO03095.1 hypothetical protein DMH26_12625 [Streptomyces sp. WAC 05379]
MAAPQIFLPLRTPRFRLLTAGQFISGVGDWLDYVAVLSLVAYQWDKGSSGLAAVAICTALPWIALSPLAGVWADRLPRRAVLVVCDLARAVIVLGYVLCHSLLPLLVLLTLKTSFSVLFSPAQAAAVQQTVPRDDLLGANALATLTTQSTKILGPALGGVLFAGVGSTGVFIADAASFLLSAAFLSQLRFPQREARPSRDEDDGKRSVWSEAVAGLAFITGRHVLLIAVLVMASTVFLVFAFDTLTPLALRELHLSPEMLGYMIGAVGMGSAVGAAAIGQWGKGISPLRLMCLAQTCAGILVASTGLVITSETYGLAAKAILSVAMFGIGVSASGLFVGYPTILQSQTPPELMGRVAALSGVIPTALQLIAPAVGAGMAAAFGTGPVFTVSGIFLTTIGIAVMFLPASRLDASADTSSREVETT